MRNKAAEFDYEEKPLAFGSNITFGWIETEEYFYLGEW